jgi:PiT family inorganic phosphate transporter
MATSIATKALKPKVAVGLAALLNFVGAFISLKVAATIAEDIVDPKAITTTIILAGLLGGIFWNLLTWRLSMPSSSSHPLIGGVVGAVIVGAGFDAVTVDGLVGEVIVPSVIAPVLALAVAATATFIVYRRIQSRDPKENKRSFRFGQVGSASLVALAHGTTDAQKTMGVITLALIANGNLSADASVPTWVIVAAATAISLGTYLGGWRIIRTLGHRITKIETPQGFSAETTSAVVILSASQAGYPLSTTHVTSGGVMGAGVGKRAAEVHWGTAGGRHAQLADRLDDPVGLLGDRAYLAGERPPRGQLGIERIALAQASARVRMGLVDLEHPHPLRAQIANQAGRGALARLDGDQGELPKLESTVFVRRGFGTAKAALPAEKQGLRFHDLRHTCATLLIAAGAHAKLLQERRALQHHHDAQPVRARVALHRSAPGRCGRRDLRAVRRGR